MNTVAISVCVPTYNYARYLPQALDSILSQSFSDFELLISDDCSTDDTAAVIKKYASRDRRIRFIVNARHLGMVENWNLCLVEARGEFIKYVFADDMLSDAGALQRLITPLKSEKRISLTGGAYKIINDVSRIQRIVAPFPHDQIFDGRSVISFCLTRQDNLIGNPTTVMFRRKHAGRGFRSEYCQIVDQEMWFHLLEKGDFAYISKPLTAFRNHPEQATVLNRRTPLAVLDDVFRLNDEYLGNNKIRLNRFWNTYIELDSVYRLWRLYLAHQIDRQIAIDRIEDRFGFLKFRLLYPFYKTIKPCLKFVRAMRRSLGRHDDSVLVRRRPASAARADVGRIHMYSMEHKAD
jgi:glycosyltransferase involved in cell wall biosynthesis